MNAGATAKSVGGRRARGALLGAALLLLGVLVLAGCGGSDDSGGGEEAGPETQPAVKTDGIEDLENVLALRSDFEADAGKQRVLILFSPT